MANYKDRTLRRVGMTDELHSSLKNLAKDNGMTLNEVYDDAISTYLDIISTHPDEKYYAPKRGAKLRSMWIDAELDECLEDVANEQEIPINRIIYTAIFDFAKEHC